MVTVGGYMYSLVKFDKKTGLYSIHDSKDGVVEEIPYPILLKLLKKGVTIEGAEIHGDILHIIVDNYSSRHHLNTHIEEVVLKLRGTNIVENMDKKFSAWRSADKDIRKQAVCSNEDALDIYDCLCSDDYAFVLCALGLRLDSISFGECVCSEIILNFNSEVNNEVLRFLQHEWLGNAFNDKKLRSYIARIASIATYNEMCNKLDESLILAWLKGCDNVDMSTFNEYDLFSYVNEHISYFMAWLEGLCFDNTTIRYKVVGNQLSVGYYNDIIG